MAKPDRQTSPPPAWSGAIASARFPAALVRGRAPAGKAVGAFVPALTRKAFEKFGFSTASLVMDWPRIAGPDLAQWTTPERVTWPQRLATAELADEGDGRAGATLALRVDPARALDVEYRTRQLVERINGYFGYRAIEKLRLLQVPLTAHPTAPATPAASSRSAPGRPAVLPGHHDCDEPLARALARLRAGVMGSDRIA